MWSGGQTPINISFVNSLAVAIPATILPIMVAAFAAYAFTFMEFPGRDWIFVAFVALLVVPNQVALVPLLQFYGQIGLTGTFPAVWLAHAGFGMPLAVYILRNYMATLPRAVIESAKIDGASHFVTFWRLIVPMSVPALVSFAIFQFLWVWNDLLVALVFLGSGENMVLTVNIKGLVGQQGQGANLLTAGAFISMVIPLVVFVSLQRYFVRGMTSGAVKGSRSGSHSDPAARRARRTHSGRPAAGLRQAERSTLGEARPVAVAHGADRRRRGRTWRGR